MSHKTNIYIISFNFQSTCKSKPGFLIKTTLPRSARQSKCARLTGTVFPAGGPDKYLSAKYDDQVSKLWSVRFEWAYHVVFSFLHIACRDMLHCMHRVFSRLTLMTFLVVDGGQEKMLDFANWIDQFAPLDPRRYDMTNHLVQDVSIFGSGFHGQRFPVGQV